jgi:hypothetical protein
MKETADQWAERWEIWRIDPDDIQHVVPIGDWVAHELRDDCVCGPVIEPCPRDDGSMGWSFDHQALDGRPNS